MKRVVGFSSQEIKDRSLTFHGVFGRIENKVKEQKYYKSHMFSNNEFTKVFREYLYNINDISTKEELENSFGKDWTLQILDGYSEQSCEVDSENKIFSIYYSDFEDYYSDHKLVKSSFNTIKDLYDSSRIPSSFSVTNIIGKISERSSEIKFNDEQKNRIADSIPDILINNNIKLRKNDVFDINKLAIYDVIEIGRGIINKTRKYEKVLGVKDITKEDAWQKYFEKYGSYLLFGNIKLNPKECLDKEKTQLLNNKYPDLITCNRYGFLDLIELKKSDLYLFKFDDSHNNLVPTPELSSAISQINNYLQVIPYAYKTKDSQDKGLQCATGMILIGDNNHLVKDSKHLARYKNIHNLDESQINFWAHQELRKLNYSYSYIQVVLYDELIDNLENFINSIK